MDITIILSIISIIGVILSLINSITNFISAKKDINIKVKMANKDIRINKININDFDIFTNISLNKICQDIVEYFEIASKHNKYTVSIFKIIYTKKVKKVSSSSNFDQNHIYDIDENTEFSETISTGKPYYVNNIPYFCKHGNKYYNSNPNWYQNYQSIICCPIINDHNKIVGFLIVEILKPLNDLIDTKKIMDFLQQECKLIVISKEFNHFNPNDD